MIIYKTTNLINNKIYIGQFNGKSKSYIGGGKYFKRAVKKYGEENFKFEIIVEGDFNIKLTDELEIHYIQLYNSTNPNFGYNLAPGGGGRIAYKLSEEHKKKISIGNKGKIKKPCSEEHKRKIGLANKGNQTTKGMKFGEDYKEACRKRMLGTKMSEETKQKMRGIRGPQKNPNKPKTPKK